MSLTTNHCTFTPDTLTVDGITYPVEYSVTPTGNVFAFVPVCIDGQERKVRIHIAPDDPFHPAALAAAKGYSAETTIPDNSVIVAETQIDISKRPADVEPEQDQHQDQDQQPARDPKQARGPVPEKDFVGQEIKGYGWKIVFDPGYDRTRVIFKKMPSSKVREAVRAAGFHWSPAMESWNKKLTHKAHRAALELAKELRTLCG